MDHKADEFAKLEGNGLSKVRVDYSEKYPSQYPWLTVSVGIEVTCDQSKPVIEKAVYMAGLTAKKTVEDLIRLTLKERSKGGT